VVPILSGSGIAMKLLDAMRAGVPVASTHAGARGLPLRDGEELLLAKNAEELAKAIARLLDDEALRRRLVRGAWSYLERNHARDALARRYREVVEAAQRMRDARAGGVR
jgi:glycosyltransferase involved in cell wall biosynthesis